MNDPIEMTAPNLVTPELDGVPEDDSAEPEDADVQHLASPEEVEL